MKRLAFALFLLLVAPGRSHAAEMPQPPYLVCVGGVSTYICYPILNWCYWVAEGCPFSAGGSAASVACSAELGDESQTTDEVVAARTGNPADAEALAKWFHTLTRKDLVRHNQLTPRLPFVEKKDHVVVGEGKDRTKIDKCEILFAPGSLTDLLYGFLTGRK